MESSVLESLGVEIIGVMTPVSICMFLVVLLVYVLSAAGPLSPVATQIRTAANLVYLESPSDSASQKLEGALLNALVFVILIAIVTFLLVLLYYYNCTNFLKHYMRFSAFFVLGTMGGSIFLSIVQHFSIPVDAITCIVLLFNFTIVGTLSVFSQGIPILLRQGYMVSLGIVVAAWFTKLPEWTTWVLLVALAAYDLVAVLAPGGPLKLLVELASSRDEELPALVYEARPTAPSNDGRNHGSGLSLLVGGVSDNRSSELQLVSNRNRNGGAEEGTTNQGYGSTEVGDVGNDIERSPLVGNPRQRDSENSASSESSSVVANSVSQEYAIDEIVDYRPDIESSPLVGNSRQRHPFNSGSSERSTMVGSSEDNIVDEETSPLMDLFGWTDRREEPNNTEISNRGIKLGLGDFIFYSVLVGRAAMYDLMTVYACYLAIVSGLGCTLILLSVYNRALPALPISIALGVIFYFLTRLFMEPFVVGTATNLMMF